MSKYIDLTHLLINRMPVYPDDAETNLYMVRNFGSNGYNSYRLETNMHAGTHIDIPMHLTENKKYISGYPLDKFTGEGVLLDVRNEACINLKDEYMDMIRSNMILLLLTGHASKYGTDGYFNNYPVVGSDFAEYLVAKKINIIGMDTPSPDKYPFDIHKILLENNIFIIENLTNLDKLLNVKRFEIIAFPLKVEAEASILRVVARII